MEWWLMSYFVGLDRTGHMSFLTGQDRTPKFAGQVLPDRTESGLLFLPSRRYQFSSDNFPVHKFGVKNAHRQNKQKIIKFGKKKLEKKRNKKNIFFFLLIKVCGPVRKTSGFRTAQTFKICRTSEPDVMSGRALLLTKKL